MHIFQYDVVVGFLKYVFRWKEAKTCVMSNEQMNPLKYSVFITLLL